MAWVVITGGGSGIGRGLVSHFSSRGPVLCCGRREEALQETKRTATNPEAVTYVACDIGTEVGRTRLLDALPATASVSLLVQNAAIGDPAPLAELDLNHFEEALRVNVVAPLALTKALLPRLHGGRVLHLGTSVAHRPQRGTATYGITKAAFFRLFQQLNAEGLDVAVGSLSPGLVDTEGVRDHVVKARSLDLPHVSFFDRAFEQGWTTNMDQLMSFVDEVLRMPDEQFISQEWRFSEWRAEVERQSVPQSESSL